MRRIQIFDTTLRDGEQSPGVNLLPSEKLEIARALEELGVDVIEAGFPNASEGDFEAVRAIAGAVTTPVVAALARTKEVDITRAAAALEGARRPRIHVFTSSSDVHLRHMLRKTQDEVVDQSVDAIRLARRYVDDVEFSGQDAMRSDLGFIYRLLEAAIEAGATVVNVPDTVGYATPEEFGALIRRIRENVRGIDRVRISVHCHNDLGLATANTLAGLLAGADQAEVAMNGIGERAGNTALEEVAMIIATRGDTLGLSTGIRPAAIGPVSRLVSRLTGMPVQPNKAIVGRNAFAHESGIHQDGVLKERSTYEIMRPEDLGVDANTLVLGKHSGRHAFRVRLQALGYEFDDAAVEELFRRFKILTDRKKEVSDEDVRALAEDRLLGGEDVFRLEAFHVSSTGGALATATVTVTRDSGSTVTEAAVGDGPVDALCQAIRRASGVEADLVHYSLRSVGEGTDAQGEVYCQVRAGDRVLMGHGVSTDVLEASALAYLAALNKAYRWQALAASTQEVG
jgi:2-isopropylmalate synthase